MTDQRGGGISWTDETWNPVRGCSLVGTECRNCYAMWTAATRMSKPGQAYHGIAEITRAGLATWTGKVVTVPDKLDEPLRWKRPRLIFVNSMSDLFHPTLTWDQIDAIVAMMALADWHTFQTLTKRPGGMRAYLEGLANRPSMVAAVLNRKALGDPDYPLQPTYARTEVAAGHYWPMRNVWWGTSAGTNQAAKERRDDVIACRDHAAVLWLSVEPLLDAVNVRPYTFRTIDTAGPSEMGGVDWIVAGGESDDRGGEARITDPEWARGIQRACYENGAAFQFKQWGSWLPAGQAAPNLAPAETNRHVGKRAAGRLLDGVQYHEWPAGFAGPAPAEKD